MCTTLNLLCLYRAYVYTRVLIILIAILNQTNPRIVYMTCYAHLHAVQQKDDFQQMGRRLIKIFKRIAKMYLTATDKQILISGLRFSYVSFIPLDMRHVNELVM